MKLKILIFIFFSLFLFGQKGLQLSAENSQVKIPFRFINNLMFVEAEINGVSMTLLLDTGVSETIIFSVEDKELTLKNIEKMNFTGLGNGEETQGLVSHNNVLKIGKMQDSSHVIYIILNTDFNFSSQVGIPVNGIIGFDFFENQPIKIDYKRKKITVYQHSDAFVKKLKKYKEIPIAIINQKPYVETQVNLKNNNQQAKLLIDTGNSDALWLFPNKMNNFFYNHPNIDDYLGRGFNGDILGKKSRIKSFSLGDFTLTQPTTSFPDENSIKNVKIIPGRVGSIGEEILRRFDVIFDYKNAKMYLKKNIYFDEDFLFNKSGLEFKHVGMQWEKELTETLPNKTQSNKSEIEKSIFSNFQYQFQLKPLFAIASCRPNSPAAMAGLKKDDLLLHINGKPTTQMTLQKIIDLMKKDDDTEITMEIMRNGTKMNFSFKLKDPIAYEE